MKQHIWIVSILLVFLNVLFFTSCEKDNEDLVLSNTIGQGTDLVFEQKLSFLKED